MNLMQSCDVTVLQDVMSQAALKHHHLFDHLMQTPEEIKTELSTDVTAWVCMDGNQVLGMVKTRCDHGVWRFWHLLVVSESDGRQLIAAMLQDLERLAKEHGCVTMECTLHFPVAGLVRWYEAVGYQVVGTNALIKASGYQMLELGLRKSLLPEEGVIDA